MPTVEQVIPMVDVRDVNVIVVIPVVAPVFRARIHGGQPISAVLEPRISSHNQKGQAVDPEAGFRPKVSPKAVVGDSVAAIAATLFPGAMLGFPPVRAMQSPTAPFNVLLVSGLRMLIAPLLALMLGRWSVLMAAPNSCDACVGRSVGRCG